MKEIILTTIDFIPGVEFEVLGIVIGNKMNWFWSKKYAFEALEDLKKEAAILGADAVIGIKPDSTSTGSQCYIGTAIRFKK